MVSVAKVPSMEFRGQGHCTGIWAGRPQGMASLGLLQIKGQFFLGPPVRVPVFLAHEAFFGVLGRLLQVFASWSLCVSQRAKLYAVCRC